MSLMRRLRWFAGYGWRASDFEARYAQSSPDSWGYRNSDAHLRRAEMIMAALPQPRFAHGLEVGCAQGFLSERLAARVDQLLACDLSETAIEQARANCRKCRNVTFQALDIRDGAPGDNYDLAVFSDVLYYLSPREIRAVLAATASRMAPGGVLLIANEWRDGASGLTSPQVALDMLNTDKAWRRESSQREPFNGAHLSLAAYRREMSPT